MEYLFLLIGVGIGVALGLAVVAFTAIGQYERGYRVGRGVHGHLP